MDMQVRLDGNRDLIGQIYRQLRAAILDGRLGAGDRLPASRDLAMQLVVSRNTVGAAYDRLTGEGFLEARIGAGTFVSRVGDVSGALAVRRDLSPLRPRAFWSRSKPHGTPSKVPPRYNFALGLPDPSMFPFESWRRLLIRELQPTIREIHGYGASAGHEGLRAAISRHIAVSRAVLVDPEHVVITNGAQQGLDLIARVMLEPGDCVAVEEPGYPPARQLFQSLGARVVPVPVDEEGLVVAALPSEARLVYVCPSHQLPLGMPMSLPRRLALLDWARTRDAAVIEDDYDSEFRFGSRPLEPLHALDTGGRVFYLGTFSKSLSPSLRLGFVVSPPPVCEALAAARHLSDRHSPLPVQAALARFIDEGLFTRHLRKMRAEYGARHETLLCALTQNEVVPLRPLPATVGLHITVLLNDGVDDLLAAARACERGVVLFPLRTFYAGRATRSGLVLGFGAIARSDIPPGISHLLGAIAAA